MKSKLFKLSIGFGKVLAALAIFVTAANVNSACIFITHQPELPQNAKKLRKF